MHCRWQRLEKAARDGILCFIRCSRPLKTGADTQHKSDNATDDPADRPPAKHRHPNRPTMLATDDPLELSSTSPWSMLCRISVRQSEEHQGTDINTCAALRSFFGCGLCHMKDEENILRFISRTGMQGVGPTFAGAECNSSQSEVSATHSISRSTYSQMIPQHTRPDLPLPSQEHCPSTIPNVTDEDRDGSRSARRRVRPVRARELLRHTNQPRETCKLSKGDVSTVTSPTSRANINIEIACSHEEALRVFSEDTAPLRIFSDGSSREGGVGCAAVLERYGRPGRRRKSVRRYIGKSDSVTSVQAEDAGLVLALQLARQQRRITYLTIYTDARANLSLLRQSISRSPQCPFTKAVLRTYQRLMRCHPKAKVVFRWIPRGCVPGNIVADRHAKWAACRGLNVACTLPAVLKK